MVKLALIGAGLGLVAWWVMRRQGAAPELGEPELMQALYRRRVVTQVAGIRG